MTEPAANPFLEEAPRFFEYLVSERGLRSASAKPVTLPCDRFQAYLTRVGVRLPQLSTPVLTAFVAERSVAGLAKTTVCDCRRDSRTKLSLSGRK